jgi:TPP-dependent pyruvate/acetoin dehydrogenase alpha subunit
LAAQLETDVRDAIARAEAAGMPPLESILDDVYEEQPWHLREQLAELLAANRVKSPHSH